MSFAPVHSFAHSVRPLSGQVPRFSGGSEEKPVKVFASPKNWIDTSAVDQLKKNAELPGVLKAVGLPDLHPGRGIPIGAAFACEDTVYPHLIGNDIGCGMALTQTHLKRGKLKLDKLEKKLAGLESPWPGDISSWVQEHQLSEENPVNDALGTIGGGNHFAELQEVQDILDPKSFEALGLAKDKIFMLVHSGSREFGDTIFRRHTVKNPQAGLKPQSDEGQAYLEEHDQAVQWAKANRDLIAHRFLEQVGTDGDTVSDNCHNSIEQVVSSQHDKPLWIHRKGAGAANQGPFMIAGSRGTLSYLVEPTGDGEDNLFSLAHGAGRKWKRGDGRKKLGERFSPEQLKRTELGGRVICEDKQLLYDEAPQAYKDSGRVVQDLVDAGLAKIIASFKPVLTYKKRREED